VAPWLLRAAASVLLFAGGIGGGWLLRGMDGAGGLRALGHDAIASYSVYAPDRLRPVEIRAQEQALLAAWAHERTGRPLAVPQLAAAGYRFMGGRVLANPQGAAVLLMYDDDRGTRLVLLAQPMPGTGNSTMAAVATGGVHGWAWSEHGMGYSLVGAAPPAALHPLAREIRQQIRGFL